MVELAGQDLEEFVDDVEALVQDFNSFGDVEVVCGASVEGLEFRVVPEEFGRVEDLAVQVDEVALDEDLAHFLRDLFAGEGDFTFLGQVEGKAFRVFDGLLDQLFEGGELDGLGDSVGDGQLGQGALVVEEDLILFDLDGIAVDIGELVELDFGQGFFFEFFDGVEDLLLFFFHESPADDRSIGEIKDIALDPLVFFDLDMDDIAKELGRPQPLQVLEQARDIIGGGSAIAGTAHCLVIAEWPIKGKWGGRRKRIF